MEEVLKRFSPVSLNQIGRAGLMERMESKYWFHENHLEPCMEGLYNHYDMLEIQEIRHHQYQSEYFDTPDLIFYHAHHNGRSNRYKIRTRFYKDSHLGFFEIKFKNNKQRTIKSRIEYPYAYGPITERAQSFIKEDSQLSHEKLSSVLQVEYKRITLVCKEKRERVTLDTDLRFISNSGKEYEVTGLVIAELKQAKKTVSQFKNRMKELHIRQESLSKYCMGMTLLNSDLKSNNFKRHIRKIKEIC